jgi:hypothetical protein
MPPKAGQSIHACPACSASWEAVSGKGLIPVPRLLVKPRMAPPRGARLVLVPVWCVTVHRHEMGEVADRMADEIRIPANGIARLPVLIEAARRLTRAAAPREDWTGVEPPVDPAEMDVETAFAVAEAVALRHVSGWPAEHEVETVRIPLGGARLVDWPCAGHHGEIIELVGGLAFSTGITENMGSRDQQASLAAAIHGLNLPTEYVPTRASG